jgi:four helix bundle protein
LFISLGSLFEIETQLILANRFGLVNSTVTENINIKISELERMIFALEKTLS